MLVVALYQSRQWGKAYHPDHCVDLPMFVQIRTAYEAFEYARDCRLSRLLTGCNCVVLGIDVISLCDPPLPVHSMIADI